MKGNWRRHAYAVVLISSNRPEEFGSYRWLGSQDAQSSCLPRRQKHDEQVVTASDEAESERHVELVFSFCRKKIVRLS